MHLTAKFLILIWICVSAKAEVTSAKPNEAVSKEANTNAKGNVAETENKTRDKRQLAYIPNASPVYFDPPQQQSGLLGLGQNIPIIGTLVSGLPVIGNGQNFLGGLPGNLGGGLNGLTSGLTGTLGNLGGTLGNLGGLGNLGLLGGATPSATGATACPATQKLACRCEPLVPLQPLSKRKDHNNDVIEIVDQSIKGNADGSTEVIAHLTNGLTIYQKANNQLMSKEIDGYYTLKIADERYLTIYYTVNDLDYTVKANVHSEPPNSHMEIDNGHQNLLGSF